MTTTSLIGSLTGFTLQPNDCLKKHRQVRFPKSKKKRMRKKWAKNPKNHDWTADEHVYIFGNNIIAHPETLAKLSYLLQERQR